MDNKQVCFQVGSSLRRAAGSIEPLENKNKQSVSRFYGLGIAPGFLEILDKLHYVTPTLIQHQCIPIAIQGKDIVGIAQTGTGKTLAFSIPMVQRLANSKGLGLVILPTRELALQIDNELHRVGDSLGLRTAVLIGGLSIRPQTEAIRRNPHIIIATPGRLIDHLRQKTVSLGRVNILVLDEADRMLDMGFLPQIRDILKAVPKERQTMIFSATISPEIMKIASANMKLPIRIEIAPTGTTVENVTQEIFIVAKDAKMRLLEKILNQYAGPVLIFTRTKYGARRLAHAIKGMGHIAAEIHSNRSLAQRRSALEGFKAGRYRVLVATDIMARGIDVVGIELVINYDLPSQSEAYVHRIGRTARAGMDGRAISFAMPGEQKEIRAIERLIRKNIKISPLPELPPGRSFSSAPAPHFSRPNFSYSGNAHRSSPFARRRPARRSFGRF